MQKLKKNSRARMIAKLMLRPEGVSSYELSEAMGLIESEVHAALFQVRKVLETAGWGIAMFICPANRTRKGTSVKMANRKRVYKIDAYVNGSYSRFFEPSPELTLFREPSARRTPEARIDYDFVDGMVGHV